LRRSRRILEPSSQRVLASASTRSAVTEHRDQIVKRVVHALDERRDPNALVWAYFDEDRDVMIEAARQTLEATREDASMERVAAAVDRELIEALRFPPNPPRGLSMSLYINRGRAALATVVATVGTLLALLLI
jgi:precorrin isomerase